MSRQLDILITAGYQLLCLREGVDHRLSSLAREALDRHCGDVRAALADVNARMAEEAARRPIYIHGADDFWEGVSDETA